MINRYLFFCSAVVLLLLCICVLSPFGVRGENASGQTAAPGPAQAAADGRSIILNETAVDFGKVEEGFPVIHSFTVTNCGKSSLQLKAFASCGCTTPILRNALLGPGESTSLDVTIDTAMKQDAVTKNVTIESNDPRQAKVTINLSMVVIDPHKGLGDSAGTKIFDDKHCAACHVARGEGKFGRDLYNADCAMCHGPKAEGAVGPALFGPYEKEEYARFMKGVLEAGSPKHKSMPGFLNLNGGPLEQKQVDSLLQYLSSISKARGL